MRSKSLTACAALAIGCGAPTRTEPDTGAASVAGDSGSEHGSDGDSGGEAGSGDGTLGPGTGSTGDADSAEGTSGDADSTGAGNETGGVACGPSRGAGGPSGENEMELDPYPAAWMYAPPDDGSARPLVVSLHGSGDDAYNFNWQFLGAAEEDGFLLVTPEGTDPMGWSPAEDGEIVFAAIEAMKERHNVDTCRIYVAGFSAGAHYSFLLGLQHADVFAGLGSIQGAIQYAEQVGVWPGMVPRKIAVDIHHGTLDGAYAAAEYSRDVLEAAGHVVYFTPLPGVGHETSQEIARGVWKNLANHRLDE